METSTGFWNLDTFCVQIMSGIARLQSALRSIGHEKRMQVFDGIIEAGLSHEMGKKKAWNEYMEQKHKESGGNLKKVYKGFMCATRHEVETMLAALPVTKNEGVV